LGGLLGSVGRVVGGVFVDERGRVVIPFRLRGTLSDPKPEPDLGRLTEMQTKGGPTRPSESPATILDRLLKRRPQ
jgi:hypothetical protein